MLVIRSDQFRTLADARRTSFEAAMIGYLRSFAHAAASTDEELLSVVRNGIVLARSFDITASGDVSRFIPYLLIYGSDFASQPWAASILNSSASGAQKMDRIDEYDLFSGRGGLVQV